MALPAKLVRYYLGAISASTWTAVHAVVPNNRALVVSKIIVSNNSGAPVTFHLGISASGGNGYIASTIPLAGGQVYTETNLVIENGFSLVAWCNTANGITVTVFGEEVDN